MGITILEDNLVGPIKLKAAHISCDPVIPYPHAFWNRIFQTMVLRVGKSI